MRRSSQRSAGARPEAGVPARLRNPAASPTGRRARRLGLAFFRGSALIGRESANSREQSPSEVQHRGSWPFSRGTPNARGRECANVPKRTIRVRASRSLHARRGGGARIRANFAPVRAFARTQRAETSRELLETQREATAPDVWWSNTNPPKFLASSATLALTVSPVTPPFLPRYK